MGGHQANQTIQPISPHFCMCRCGLHVCVCGADTGCMYVYACMHSMLKPDLCLSPTFSPSLRLLDSTYSPDKSSNHDDAEGVMMRWQHFSTGPKYSTPGCMSLGTVVKDRLTCRGRIPGGVQMPKCPPGIPQEGSR